MLNVALDKKTGFLELTVDGPIEPADYARAVEAVETLLTTHKKIDVVQVIRDLGWIDPGVWWRDLLFHLTHRDFIRHAAIVSDKHWVESITNLLAPIYPAAIRTFKLDEIEAARRWAKAPTPSPGTEEEPHLDFA